MLTVRKFQTNRAGGEAESLAETIHQIALIGEMNAICLVDKDDKGWRANSGLGDVEKLEPFALVHGRLVVVFGIFQQTVELRGRYFAVEFVADHLNICHDFADALTTERRHKMNGAVGKETESTALHRRRTRLYSR